MAIFIIYCNNAIVHAIEVIYSSTSDGAEEMIDAILMKSLVGFGIPGSVALILYIGIVFQTMFFLIAYINRVLKIGFLLIISPLITVTYAIDKMGDGKAQALDTWLKEFIFTILIQPFHCIIYFSFISIAFALVVDGGFDGSMNQLAAGLLAILCIKFVNDGEKIVRKIFGFQDDNSKTSMAAGAMMAVATAKNASKIGSTAKKGVNAIAARGIKYKDKIAKALPQKTDAEKAAKKAAKNEKALEKEMDKNGGGYARGANETDEQYEARRKSAQKNVDAKNQRKQERKDNVKSKINGAKSMYGKFSNSKAGFVARKAFASSAAVMAFAATYATGDTDMLSAIGYGSAAAQGVNKAFENSRERNDSDAVDNQAELLEAERERMSAEVETRKDEIQKDEGLLDKFDDIAEDYQTAKENDQKASQLTTEASNIRKQITPEMDDEEKRRLEKEAKRKEEDAEKCRIKAEEARNRAEEKDPDGIVKKYIDDGKDKVDFRDDLERKKDELCIIEDELENFYTETVVKHKLDSLRNSVTDQQIKAKANEIERLIQEIMASRHLQGNVDGLDFRNEISSDEDTEAGSQISTKLLGLMGKDLIEHSGLSSMDLIKEAGLGELTKTDGSINARTQSLMKQLDLAVAEQKMNYRVRAISQNQELDRAMYGDGKNLDDSLLEAEFYKRILGTTVARLNSNAAKNKRKRK